MNRNNTYFSRRLKGLFAITDLSREALARYMGVTANTVRLWENGGLIPDVYQFQRIAAFFGLPYAWFLDGTDGMPDKGTLAMRLGLSEDTIQTLMDLAETEPENVLDALDDAVYALASAVIAVREDMEDEE